MSKGSAADLPKLHRKLKEYQAERRVAIRKWDALIDQVEMEIQRIARESRRSG